MEKIQIIERLFYYTNICTYLILPLIFLFAKTKKGDSRLLALYGLICFCLLYSYNELPGTYREINIYLYTYIEYLFFTILICSKINNPAVKKIIIACSVLFFGFQFISYLYFRGEVLDSTSIGIETILIFLYVVYFFYEYFRKPKPTYIYTNHFFWIVVGIMIYLGGTFFFNILANHIPKAQIKEYWELTYIPEIIKNLLFGVALLIYSYKSNENRIHHSKIPYLDLDIH